MSYEWRMNILFVAMVKAVAEIVTYPVALLQEISIPTRKQQL